MLTFKSIKFCTFKLKELGTHKNSTLLYVFWVFFFFIKQAKPMAHRDSFGCLLMVFVCWCVFPAKLLAGAGTSGLIYDTDQQLSISCVCLSRTNNNLWRSGHPAAAAQIFPSLTAQNCLLRVIRVFHFYFCHFVSSGTWVKMFQVINECREKNDQENNVLLSVQTRCDSVWTSY